MKIHPVERQVRSVEKQAHRAAAWLALALVVLAQPLMVRAESNADRQSRIRAMSPEKRQQLALNLKLFKELPDTERTRYRDLHAQVTQDPRLKSVLQSFSDWLKTLTEEERAKIGSERNPDKRQELVKRLRDEHSPKKPAAPPGNSGNSVTSDSDHPDAAPLNADNSDDNGGLDDEDLGRVMKALESVVRKRGSLKAEEAENLEDLQGADRYLFVLKMFLMQRFEQGEKQPRPLIQGGLLDLSTAVLNPDHQQKLKSADRPAKRQSLLFGMINSGIQRQLAADLDSQPAKRSRMLSYLDFAQKSDVENAPSKERQNARIAQYTVQNQYRQATHKAHQKIEQLKDERRKQVEGR